MSNKAKCPEMAICHKNLFLDKDSDVFVFFLLLYRTSPAIIMGYSDLRTSGVCDLLQLHAEYPNVAMYQCYSSRGHSSGKAGTLKPKASNICMHPQFGSTSSSEIAMHEVL